MNSKYTLDSLWTMTRKEFEDAFPNATSATTQGRNPITGKTVSIPDGVLVNDVTLTPHGMLTVNLHIYFINDMVSKIKIVPNTSGSNENWLSDVITALGGTVPEDDIFDEPVAVDINGYTAYATAMESPTLSLQLA